MKRSSPLKHHGVSSSDVFSNLTKEQLTMIGAVAIAYNDVEEMLDRICESGLHLPIPSREVLHRINGADGKVVIAKKAARACGLGNSEMNILCEALGDAGFKELKGYRDGVVHARVYDISSGVGRTRGRHAKVADVLLTVPALTGLYERLAILRWELRFLDDIVARASRIKRGGITDQHKERLESENRASLAQARKYQTRRLSLPPLPEFPQDILDLSPLRAEQDRKPEAGER